MLHPLTQPIKIGSLEVKNRIFLAPLAGVSDVPFRRICQEQGAGLTYVEMLSATALTYTNKKTFEMLARHKSEQVLGVQVTGPRPEEIGAATKILNDLHFDTIDINMGCPVRKVTSAGCGSAILKNPENLQNIVKAASANTSLPLSAKIRLGFTREDLNVIENCGRIASEDVSMLTIHGRTRNENYSIPVDHSGIKLGIDHVEPTRQEKQLKTVGNGDIFTVYDAHQMVERTGCDAVMVSRGALGNPWIFKEILLGETYQPTLEEWMDVVFRHMDYHQAHYQSLRYSAIIFRKHLLWYCKGFPGMRALRKELSTITCFDTAKELIIKATKDVDKNLRRFADAKREMANPDYDPKYEMDRKLDRGVGHLDMQENPST